MLSRRFRNVVGSIIILFDSLSTIVLKSLSPALSESINITLEPLKSLLNVPDDRTAPIRLLHPSFRDFLVNQKRCGVEHFWIDERKAHLSTRNAGYILRTAVPLPLPLPGENCAICEAWRPQVAVCGDILRIPVSTTAAFSIPTPLAAT